jgi:hypothetical protein
MDEKYTIFTLKYFAIPFAMLAIGFVAGFGLSNSKKKPNKYYPIKVQSYWKTDGYQGYPTMDADSVINDTIYKDGLKIVDKNILNIEFK